MTRPYPDKVNSQYAYTMLDWVAENKDTIRQYPNKYDEMARNCKYDIAYRIKRKQ